MTSASIDEHSGTMWDQSIKEARAKFLHVDETNLKAHIEHQVPSSSVTIRNFRTLTEGSGMSNGITFFTADIETPGGSETRDLVLRYAPGVSLIRQKSFSDEYFTLRAANETSLPAPRAYWPDLEGDILGLSGFIMDRVEASSVPSSMYTSGPIADASPADRKEMLLQVAGLQGGLRKAEIGPGKVPHLLKKGSGATDIERELNWWFREGELSVPAGDARLRDIQAVRDWMIAHQPPARPATLTHGDGQPCNVMYRGTEAACWLDWELAYIGHQETDLMLTILTTELTKPAGVEIEGIPTENEFIQRFEREAGAPVEYWEYFRLVKVYKYIVSLLWVTGAPYLSHIYPIITSYLERYWAEARGAARSYTART